MGKAEDEQNLTDNSGSEGVNQNVEPSFLCGCGWIYRIVGFKCFLMLFLSLAVFISALFWLPPFLHFADRDYLDLDSKFKDHDVVASFNVEKPVSFLEDNIVQLEFDIFNEIGVPTTKVLILSLDPLAGSNITKVVFGVDPDTKDSKISLPSQSLIRASFVALVTKQTVLRLTKSLFGDPFFFEVLKFPRGITVIPMQSGFLLQKEQILFNFTLNFSIYQIQENFNELTSQLKLGLRLTPYENLYISLSNSKGSTMAPPTIVQSSVLLAIGSTPSMPRLKQLAQTITGSHSKNLGLNNTVFGRVKQVRLSSILQHSLHGGDSGGTPSPAPLPLPHHHHHHHHHSDKLAPATSPIPAIQRGAPAPSYRPPPHRKSAPAPKKSYEAKPPGCRNGNKNGYTRKARKRPPLTPTVAPRISPHYFAVLPPPAPMHAPVPPSIPTSSPLPNVIFAHAHPPSHSGSDGKLSDTTPSVSPSSSSSCAGHTTVGFAFSLFLAIVLHL